MFVYATGSIGLEEDHGLADLMAFSSCKGLFGLTGASFIAHKRDLTPKDTEKFYFNVATHKQKMVTGPYHAIASLYNVIEKHSIFRERVERSKQYLLDSYSEIVREDNQPLLCTYLGGRWSPEMMMWFLPRPS